MRIFSVRFHPEAGTVIPHKNPHIKFCRAGAENAAAAAGAYLDEHYDGNRGAAHLEWLAKEAIDVAISAAGPQEDGSPLTCGGSIENLLSLVFRRALSLAH